MELNATNYGTIEVFTVAGPGAVGTTITLASSDPNDNDSDDDLLMDNDEVNGTSGFKSDPNNTNRDGDGLDDKQEADLVFNSAAAPSNPNDADSDDDTLRDDAETLAQFNDGSGYPGITVNGGAVSLTATNPIASDTDGDGIDDNYELLAQKQGGAANGYADETNPNLADTDSDGLSDAVELNATGYGSITVIKESGTVIVNLTQTNPNHSDSDNDSLTDSVEILATGYVNGYTATDPNASDTDGDTIDDNFEMVAKIDATTDYPNSRSNLGVDTGVKYGTTNPLNFDTDGDLLSDSHELNAQNSDGVATGYLATNPNEVDSDSDCISDYDEVNAQLNGQQYPQNIMVVTDTGTITISFSKTNPLTRHSDGDDVSDYFELTRTECNLITDNSFGTTSYPNLYDGNGALTATQISVTDPNDPDTDGDLLSDHQELFGIADINALYGQTNPNHFDSDGDTISDFNELARKIDQTTNYPNAYNDDGTISVTPYPATNPNNQDTDGDLLSDDVELKGTGYDAFSVTVKKIDNIIGNCTKLYDLDSGSKYSCVFSVLHTNPNVEDSDGDGLTDYQEMNALMDDGVTPYPQGVSIPKDFADVNVPIVQRSRTNPNDKDSDDDMLTDYQELRGWNQNNLYYEKTYANDTEGGSAIVINSISYNYPSTDPNDDDTDSDEKDVSDGLDLRDGPEVRSDAIGNGYFTDPHVVDE